jgi:hypothetical protein
VGTLVNLYAILLADVSHDVPCGCSVDDGGLGWAGLGWAAVKSSLLVCLLACSTIDCIAFIRGECPAMKAF